MMLLVSLNPMRVSNVPTSITIEGAVSLSSGSSDMDGSVARWADLEIAAHAHGTE